MIIFLQFTNSPIKTTITNRTQSITPIPNANTTTTNNNSNPNTVTYDFTEEEYPSNPDAVEGVVRKETQPNGITKLYLPSPDTNHQNIMLFSDNKFIFKRIVNNNDDFQPIQLFLDMYGSPNSITNGSSYYGPSYNKYIYSDLGFTLIVNENSMVVEQHEYPPTSVESYSRRFGNEQL